MAGTISYFHSVFLHIICSMSLTRGKIKILRNWYREAKIKLSISSFMCIDKIAKIFLAAHTGSQEVLYMRNNAKIKASYFMES